MRSDAYVTVECDKCGEEEQVKLCSLARGGWDERNVNSHLETYHWRIGMDGDICPDCAADEDE